MVKNVWSSADVDLTLRSYILFTQFHENYMILFQINKIIKNQIAIFWIIELKNL
jgi:hypothetical protein